MAIGADVGGSRLKIVRLVHDEVVSRRQVEIKRDWPLQLAEELAGLVEGDEAVGVGVGGLVDHKTGIMHLARHLSGVAIPVGDNLSERLGRRVEVDNDANCATRAEAVIRRSNRTAGFVDAGAADVGKPAFPAGSWRPRERPVTLSMKPASGLDAGSSTSPRPSTPN